MRRGVITAAACLRRPKFLRANVVALAVVVPRCVVLGEIEPSRFCAETRIDLADGGPPPRRCRPARSTVRPHSVHETSEGVRKDAPGNPVGRASPTSVVRHEGLRHRPVDIRGEGHLQLSVRRSHRGSSVAALAERRNATVAMAARWGCNHNGKEDFAVTGNWLFAADVIRRAPFQSEKTFVPQHRDTVRLRRS
jgi:hypothetical protein